MFDILYFNGESLINKPLEYRRKLLEQHFIPIKNKVHLSELTIIKSETKLRELMENAIHKNLEGLVLKDSKGIYSPNKRHWLKMKKDYLGEGEMADSADLVVLGAYKGNLCVCCMCVCVCVCCVFCVVVSHLLPTHIYTHTQTHTHTHTHAYTLFS